ncbi:MAG: hypothetical protein ACLR06_07265 [Christensenellaceae bacterium]
MEDIEIIAMPKKRGRPAKQENTEDMIRLYEQGKPCRRLPICMAFLYKRSDIA